MFDFIKNKKDKFKYGNSSDDKIENTPIFIDDEEDEEDDYYIQISFDTEPEPEPEPEPIIELTPEPNIDDESDMDFGENIEFDLESDTDLDTDDNSVIEEESDIQETTIHTDTDFELNDNENNPSDISTNDNSLNDLDTNTDDSEFTNLEDMKSNYFKERYYPDSDLQQILDDVLKSKNKTLKRSVLISTLLSSVITFSAVSGYHYILSGPTTKTEIVIDGNGKSTNIYKAVAIKGTPSVVGITTLTIDTNNFLNFPMQSEGVGSGVVINKNGYILTNSHVVDDGRATKVSVLFADGTTSNGKVLWNDGNLDLAIVKVDKKNLDVAELGNSDEVEVGDLAIAIGNPIGLELNKSVTQGIISGKDRSLATNKGSMTGLIQTDASINPGNSGGPLLNDKGQVIGINTAKLSDAEGLGFAIPINIAKPIVEQIINKGDFEKVSLGIKGVDVANVKTYLGLDLPVEDGVYVIEASNDSPATNAGVKTGDTIISIDDHNITSMSDLNKSLYEYRKGDNAKIKIVREGKEYVLDLNFSKQISTINTDNNNTNIQQ